MNLLTTGQAAERLNISERTLRREIAAGRLAVIRIGRLVRICAADVDAFILANREQRPGGTWQSKNVVDIGAFASNSAAKKLGARLGKGRPDRMLSNLRRRSVAITSQEN